MHLASAGRTRKPRVLVVGGWQQFGRPLQDALRGVSGIEVVDYVETVREAAANASLSPDVVLVEAALAPEVTAIGLDACVVVLESSLAASVVQDAVSDAGLSSLDLTMAAILLALRPLDAGEAAGPETQQRTGRLRNPARPQTRRFTGRSCSP